MSVQEILGEIQKLPSVERKELLDSLTSDEKTKIKIQSEDIDRQLQEKLLSNGLISEIKPARSVLPQTKFQPVAVIGEPVSETIIRERR